MSIEVLNLSGIRTPHDIKTLDSLVRGELFIYQGKLAVLIDDDPQLMFLGGTRHGEIEDVDCSDAEIISVKVVDVKITVKEIPPPKPKTNKKKK